MDVHALRLKPGDDLKKSLMQYAAAHELTAGCIITCVGSLQRLHIRLANASADEPNHVMLRTDQRFEIVSLVGTLNANSCHVHISIADSCGALLGGHLLDGCVVFTTAEIVLGECRGYRFDRVLDHATGFPELDVTKEAHTQRDAEEDEDDVHLGSLSMASPDASASLRGKRARRARQWAKCAAAEDEARRSGDDSPARRGVRGGVLSWMRNLIVPEPASAPTTFVRDADDTGQHTFGASPFKSS